MLTVQCAQVQPLSGGKKDTVAAQIDTAKTYPRNQQTNFEGESMVIAFDEYIKLEKPAQNIVMTPTFSERVNYEIQGKKLIIEFPETPRPSTTYRLSIDGGIVDYNEGNDSLYTFVFSSGDHIDSACIEGEVENAFTNEPLKEAYVLIYQHENIDSIQLRRADYFTKTDDQGHYFVKNMKPGPYEIIAVEDQNQSRSYDLPSEKVGFTKDRLINIPSDSCAMQNLATSAPVDTSRYIKNARQIPSGAIGFAINNWKDYQNVAAKILNDSITITRDTFIEDSIVFWPDSIQSASIAIEVAYGNSIDTVTILQKNEKPESIKWDNNLKNNKLLPSQKLTLNTNTFIKSINDTLISVFKNDSIPINDFKISQAGLSHLTIELPKKINSFKVKIDSAAITSKFGSVSKSETIDFKRLKPTDYATIILEMDSTFVDNGYIVLKNAEDEVIQKKKLQKQEIRFKNLISTDYFLYFVNDRNNNNRWDAGSYQKRRLPEEVYYLEKSVTPKKGWEQKVEWSIDEKSVEN